MNKLLNKSGKIKGASGKNPLIGTMKKGKRRNKEPSCPKYSCDHPNYLEHDCDDCEYVGRRVDGVGEESKEMTARGEDYGK